MNYSAFLTAALLFIHQSLFPHSEIDQIIAPEVINDSFYQSIERLAATADVVSILEIGSSSGDGSTEAFVSGLLQNPKQPALYCMELSKPRFEMLQTKYQNVRQVKCYNVSTVPINAFPSKRDVKDFYTKTKTNLNKADLNLVLKWLEQDIEYVKTAAVPTNGIEKIKTENQIEYFGIVLIDGSEFTGKSEFNLIYGAKYILLDDVNAFKNYANYHKLLSDPSYELIEEDWNLRNGYAIFKNKN